MQQRSKHRFANLPEGGENPLDYAVAQRDKSTLTMVQDAVDHKQTLMAYQPVIRDVSSNSVAFHEGLIRVLDPTGPVPYTPLTLPTIITVSILSVPPSLPH